MSSDEVPPAWMWPFESELKLHFEKVEVERKAKFSGNGEDTSIPPADEVHMMGNALANQRRG